MRTFVVMIENEGATGGLEDQVFDILSNHFEVKDVHEQTAVKATSASGLYTVVLTEASPDHIIPAIREVRQISQTLTGKSMSLVKAKDMVCVHGLGREATYPRSGPISDEVATDISSEQAEAIRLLLMRVGVTVEIKPAE